VLDDVVAGIVTADDDAADAGDALDGAALALAVIATEFSAPPAVLVVHAASAVTDSRAAPATESVLNQRLRLIAHTPVVSP